jgi:hypothetical protein
MGAAAGITIAPALIPFVTGIINAQLLSYVLDKFADVVKTIDSSITKFVLDSLQAITEWIGSVYEFIRNNNAGVRYVASNPYFKVDTGNLRLQAARINNVNNRLRRLDEDLRSLYWQVGLLDIWDILTANLLTCESATLIKAKTYLENAANRFETADNRARGYIGG